MNNLQSSCRVDSQTLFERLPPLSENILLIIKVRYVRHDVKELYPLLTLRFCFRSNVSHDLDQASRFWVVRYEEHKHRIGKMACADSTSVRVPRARVDKNVVGSVRFA